MSDIDFHYYERVQTHIEDTISASIDAVLHRQPENPVLAIAEEMIRREQAVENKPWYRLVLEHAALKERVAEFEKFQRAGSPTGADSLAPLCLQDRLPSMDVSVEEAQKRCRDATANLAALRDPDQTIERIGAVQTSAELVMLLRPSDVNEEDAMSQAETQEGAISALRNVLSDAQSVISAAQGAIDSLLVAAPATSRAGYLVSCRELIGPRPLDRDWQDEWEELKIESYTLSGQTEFATHEYVRRHATIETTKHHFEASIQKLIDRGWPEDDATTYRLLSTVAGAIGHALSEKNDRFAASTYAMRRALYAAIPRERRSSRNSGSDAGDERDGEHVAPLLYWHLRGQFSLCEGDEGWGHVDVYDRNGFRGLTCSSLVRVTREVGCFDEAGFKVKVNRGGEEQYESVGDTDVVAFISQRSSWQFGHSAILTDSNERGAFPPNTLFRLKEIKPPGEWEAPGGCWPRQRLLMVTATYQSQDLDATAVASSDSCGNKMCGEVVTLQYSRSEAHVAGIEDLTAKPMLTMADECSRDLRWVDWRGARYSLRDEWAYVNGAAVRTEDCTPGIRDKNNDGLTPSDFFARVNSHIADARRRGHGALLPAEYASLTLDEVLAVRLYSGPAFQPINEFLRQISKLTGELRTQMARHPALTFTATIGHICRAIRKLAAVEPPEHMTQRLFRGVRGELPRTFWVPDSHGMVCAVDYAFMSTSRNQQTPIDYMQDLPWRNVLWELHPQPESDTGFHRGASISLLSQFEREEEVLYPPCTLLRVLPAGVDPTVPPALHSTRTNSVGRQDSDSVSGMTEPYQVRNERDTERNKRFMRVAVLPSFQ